ncbi:MAG: AraC family transcriptional regulator [Melioribacteraceae bacterium]|nr:MAG: AraC family transcriptional regulator [Melioribacteraceae bacterium]
MISQIHFPAEPLNYFIESFYYYKDYNPAHLVDRLLPDGNVQLIFELTDVPKYIYDNNTLTEIQSCRNTWFAGLRNEPITIPSGRESEMIIVSFRKGRAYPFLNEPMFALKNYVIDAELLWENQILDIRSRLQEIKNPREKLVCLESKLLQYYGSKLATNGFVDFAVSEISKNPTGLRLKELIAQTGYSKKHIIKTFKEKVGTSPKEFAKILRFQKAIKLIEAGGKVDWSSVAFDCGFFDQSHFIADFKQFSGFTPSEYFSRKSDQLNYVPII